jgi:hypothetical protein
MAMLAFALSACDRVPGTEAYAIRVAEDRAAKLLLDPGSAVFSDVAAYGGQNERVCGTINGRNRMGGYAEPVRFISSPSLTVLGPNSSEEDAVEICLFAAATAFYCADVLGPAIATAGCE